MALKFLNDGFFDGKVGIGTNSPEKKLDVRGDIQIHSGSSANSVQELGFKNFINTAFLRASYTNPASITETYLAFHTNTSGAINGTVAEQMRIAGNKVGIGTSIPSAKLDVKETTSDVAGEIIVGGLIDGGTDNVAFGKLSFANTNAANTQTNDILASIAGEKPDSSNRGELVFSTSNETAPVERMRIDKDGLVGIGTDDPDHTLHVSAAAGSAKITSTAGGANLFLESLATATSRIRYNGLSPFAIRDDNTNSDRLTILANGNVGIGTTSPGALLHVRAATDVTGTIEVQGGKATVTAVGEVNSELNFGSNDASIVGGIGGSIKSITESVNGSKAGMGFYTALQGRTPELKEAMRIDSDGNFDFKDGSALFKKQILNNNNANVDGSNFKSSTTNKASNLFAYEVERNGSSYGITNAGELIASDATFGGDVGIGTTSPISPLQIIGGTSYQNISIGSSLNDNTAKRAGITFPHYDAQEEQVALINSYIDTNISYVSIGGSATAFNATENIRFYTAANTNTLGGTERMRINGDGNVGIGTTNPTAPLQVAGIAEYTNNTTAKAAGLTAGAFYRTGDLLKVVH